MPPTRDASGRFASKPPEARSPGYQRRIERARVSGKALAEARGHSTRAVDVRLSRDAFGTEPYERSLQVLRRMRSGESLTAASRAEGVLPDTVRRHIGAALERDPSGRYRAKPKDRFYREMPYLTPQGHEWVAPRDSEEASKLAEYHNAVEAYLLGDERPLRRFSRMRLRLRDGTSLPFITDLDRLDRLAAAGRLHFNSIYRLVA